MGYRPRMVGVDHYFSPSPVSQRRPRTVTLRLADLTVDLRTDRGVYSADRIDPGTLLLLKHAPLPPAPAPRSGGPGAAPVRVLADVGCGYGPIAVTLALRAPDAAVWAIDVNERARELATANLAAVGVPRGGVADGGQHNGSHDRAGHNDHDRAGERMRARVCSPEEVPEALRFDAVYCNPPVRIGKAALDDLLAGWLRRLRRGGFAVLVMHKNLGADSLARRLAAAGTTPRRLAVGGGYRVLQVPAADRAEP